MKLIIVGGVAGGATAAARLRRLDEKAEIILLERGPYVSYANCGLPYYTGGAIARREALFVTQPEQMRAKYGLDVRTEHEVLKIFPAEKEIEIKNLKTNEIYRESYDKLLLSTGSRPFVPGGLAGLDAPNIFQLWTVPDVDAITTYIEKNQPRKAVVVGGGFIGLEMAENLAERGLEVALVEMAPQVMPPLDPDMAKLVENHLVSKGVALYLKEGFAGTKEHGKTVLLSSGKEIDTDMTLLSIGVRPNNELARDAGLELGFKDGVKVDSALRTSDPDIYAVGDLINVEDYVVGGATMIPLAGPANKQGRLAADNILCRNSGEAESFGSLADQPDTYPGTIGTSVAKVFDLSVASCGANEKTLTRVGKVYGQDYFMTILHPMSHAGYYPGALPMTIKLLFGTDRKVLGAQIVGYDGVDKRIDTISATIHFKGTIDDLAELELAYAPPYSSAKDPVNFAGFTAQNILSGLTTPLLYRELKENPEAYTLLDIREDPEVTAGSLPNSLHIPLTRLRSELGTLDKSKHYAVYCAVGLRGYVAERVLKQYGFQVSNLLGGYRTAMDLEQDIDPASVLRSQNGKIPQAAESAAFSGQMNKPGSNMPQNNDQVSADGAKPARVEILDVCGLSCPGPIVQVSKLMTDLDAGDQVEVTATDPGFARDIDSWAKNTGNTVISQTAEKGKFTAVLMKGQINNRSGSVEALPVCPSGNSAMPAQNVFTNQAGGTLPCKEKTMIIFDNDLDRAIASFIIATGAAAMGNKVHMFFTFWGLSIIRKENPPKVKKDFMSKMFGMMLPKSSKKLSLSQMNMFGMGSKMIRKVMRDKGVTSLEDLIKQAIDAGVEMTACQMSMDVMGLSKEELIDGVEVGGVASMLADNDNSNMNLFI